VKFEKNQFGGHFLEKPYYPMYLANGTDALMVNILGSGDAWFELCDYRPVLSLQYSAGWYKCNRRTFKETALVYGRLIPLFEFASSPVVDGQLLVPRNCQQYFNPHQATLTTLYEQKDSETDEWLRVKVTTFLTSEHILVEHYEFLETPEKGASIQFFINAPSRPHLDLYREPVVMDEVSLEIDIADSIMSYACSFEALEGGAVSWMDCAGDCSDTARMKYTEFVSGWLRTCTMHSGESFTRYLIAIDNYDSDDWKKTIEGLLARTRKQGYKLVLEEHRKEWERYFSTCNISLPDPGYQFIYDVGRYLMRANHHASGFHPVGLFPYLWQGVMFWDTGFVLEAMEGCGNFDQAQETLSHLRTYLPAAQDMARRFNAKGARLEWTVEIEKFTDYHTLTYQVHNNGWWAHQIYNFYEMTGDIGFLETHFDIMEELILFLVDGFLEDRGTHFIVRKCEGQDESIAREKINDTWTCAVLLKCLVEYRHSLSLLKKTSRIDNLDEIIRKLGAGLAMNVDGEGVLQSFQGGRIPHWGSLIFDLFPEHPSLWPTIKKMMDNYDPTMGTWNFHGVNRYAEKAFPWASFWVARILSRAGKSVAMEVLRKTAEHVNYFGGMPERVFYHGEYFNEWFQTASAAFVWAINGMLANFDGKTLRILVSASDEWKDVSFKGIHAGKGLVVAAEIRAGVPVYLEITNLFPEEREIECMYGAGPAMAILLKPGTNICRISRP